ncbi:hypothetical protein [Pseudalkalibacillus berkeleyi]|uniref:Uncharacterized protein n=1 Tax=Pseudalkalibacillus berkeleyi TaxID=1069813 RepID=A0ABS9GXW9_9BACL|nr:hypothetical protein [Pseudalkalibacillus berkeleyi]MCF6136460.1 hypothetical protein [Pseudalkalibacillus berkeleyi]
MFKQYIRFNLLLLPLYLLLGMALIIGILLTAEREGYFTHMAIVILQLWVLTIIPNIIYCVMKRNEPGNILGFLITLVVCPVPYFIIAVIMRVTYVQQF